MATGQIWAGRASAFAHNSFVLNGRSRFVWARVAGHGWNAVLP
jgi:hypothetical protein